MFNVGDEGVYRFGDGGRWRSLGTIVKITTKFLFVDFDIDENKGNLVVFNADGSGTSRGVNPNTFANGDRFPDGVDDGSDQGSIFVVTKPATFDGYRVRTDSEVADEARRSFRDYNDYVEELTHRGYHVDIIGLSNPTVHITKTIQL